MESRKKTARAAGLLYVVLSIPGPFVLLYIPGKLMVKGNAAATAHNILASQPLFGTWIAGELIFCALFLVVPLALYRLLKEVDKTQASLMVTLFALSVPITSLNTVNLMAALRLIQGANFLSTFDQPQREALAMLFLKLHGDGFIAAQFFWGAWLLPLGILVYKSSFLPRILGVWLIIACFAYIADGFGPVLWPAYLDAVSRITLVPKLGEVALMLWLLVMGAKEQTAHGAVA